MLRPFKFELEKYDKKRVELVDAVHNFLPSTGRKNDVINGIKNAFSRHLNSKVSLKLEAIHLDTYANFIVKMGGGPIAVLGMNPINSKAICDIDSILSVMFVERLLGKKNGKKSLIRKLTDTEMGVLQYLILKIMEVVYEASGKNEKVHFRFDRFADDVASVRDIASSNDKVVIVIFRLESGRSAGFIRLALPDPFILESIAGCEPESRYVRSDILKKFSSLRVSLSVEAGKSALTQSEILSIEEGDVVLFDDTELGLSEKGMYGKVFLHLEGASGEIESELRMMDGIMKCVISGIRKGDLDV